MMRSMKIGLAVAAVMIGNAAADGAEEAAGPGVGPGARLLVTKAFPNHGRLSEEDFRQIAGAGFTVAVRKWSLDFDNQPTLEHYVDGAAAAGLDVMIWRFGLVDAEDASDQTVTRAGKTTRYTTPWSPSAWAAIRADAEALATLSLARPNLKGIAFDFEIYDRNKTDGYCESYDDASFTAFFASLSRKPPAVEPDQRHSYLTRTGMLDRYTRFQYARVEDEVKRLREGIDAINPGFQIGVYGWGAMVPAVMEHSATAEAPVLQMSAMTYGRTIYSNAFDGGYDAEAPDRPSLKWSLLTAAKEAADARRRSYPVVSLAGHYPQSPGPTDGTQHRYTARQAFNSAVYADGYWIWTDWLTPEPYASRQAWIDDLLASFSEANAAVEAGDWTWSSRQEDQSPDPAATAPMAVLTRDPAGRVTAWDPATGTSTGVIAQTPRGPWGRTAQGDVDGVEGPERLRIEAGVVEVMDASTGIVLLRFRVNEADRQMMLVPQDRLK